MTASGSQQQQSNMLPAVRIAARADIGYRPASPLLLPVAALAWASSLSSAPSCKQTPVVVEPVGSGSADEPPLPPEEPASGPVTQPD